jgi:hypothetical protein
MAATELLSDKEVAALSAEIDRQLYALSSAPRLPLAVLRGEDGGGVPELHRKQLETLASATREPARSFLQRFLNTARSDLCDEGGGLHAQWKKWGDVENPEVIRTFAALLAGMGFTGSLVPTLVVPLAVIVLNIGVKTLCKEMGARENGTAT